MREKKQHRADVRTQLLKYGNISITTVWKKKAKHWQKYCIALNQRDKNENITLVTLITFLSFANMKTEKPANDTNHTKTALIHL